MGKEYGVALHRGCVLEVTWWTGHETTRFQRVCPGTQWYVNGSVTNA